VTPPLARAGLGLRGSSPCAAAGSMCRGEVAAAAPPIYPRSSLKPVGGGGFDFFPLPLPPAPVLNPTGSRASRRHAVRRREISEEGRDALKALNALYGCEDVASRPSSLDSAHMSVYRHVFGSIAAAKPEAPPPAPRAACAELLSGLRGSYSGGSTTVRPFDPQLVACPTLDRPAVRIQDVLGSEGDFLNDADVMLAEEQVYEERLRENPVQLYQDEALRSSASARTDFLNKLAAGGLLGATRFKRCSVTPVFVL